VLSRRFMRSWSAPDSTCPASTSSRKRRVAGKGSRDLDRQVRRAVEEGPLPVRKALIIALVEEAETTSITPVFRVPAGQGRAGGGMVQPLSGSAPSTGFEPVAYCSGGSRSIP
jgi:hypothetical protein